jgi:pimeloyl-ACP methyl ester carboxylesterase
LLASRIYNFLKYLFLFSLLILFLTFSFFYIERYFFVKNLDSNSEIINTLLGPVELSISKGTGPVILHIHGSPGGYDQVFGLDKKYKVLSPSRPGYLRTPITSGKTPEEQADLYKALLEELEIDSVIVWGTSGGGPSAIEFAIKYPESTRGLIAFEALTGPWLEAKEIDQYFLGTSDFSLWFSLKLSEVFGKRNLVSFVVPDVLNQNLILDDEVSFKEFKKLIWTIWPISMRQEGFSNDAEMFFDLSLDLEKISSPTIAIHGTKDINVDISHSIKLTEAVKNSKLHRIIGADHYMSFSHREEINKFVSKFIDDL